LSWAATAISVIVEISVLLTPTISGGNSRAATTQ
jgi:hypothetical protein